MVKSYLKVLKPENVDQGCCMERHPSLFLEVCCQLVFPCRHAHMFFSDTPSLHIFVEIFLLCYACPFTECKLHMVKFNSSWKPCNNHHLPYIGIDYRAIRYGQELSPTSPYTIIVHHCLSAGPFSHNLLVQILQVIQTIKATLIHKHYLR